MSEALAVALASQSPRRRQLLEGLGLAVEVLPSTFDERSVPWHGDPARLAESFARRKADCAVQSGPALLIAADTIVVIDDAVLGKPSDAADARRMLRLLAGREHTVHTGFCVVDRDSGRRQAGVESTSVRFLPLSHEQIDGYVASGDPMDKAGAYGIQGRGGLLVERIDGDFYTVMGLPLARVGQALLAFGHDVLAR